MCTFNLSRPQSPHLYRRCWDAVTAKCEFTGRKRERAALRGLVGHKGVRQEVAPAAGSTGVRELAGLRHQAVSGVPHPQAAPHHRQFSSD